MITPDLCAWLPRLPQVPQHGTPSALLVRAELDSRWPALVVVLALVPPGLRVFPRTTLAILAPLSLLVAAAVIWNTRQLILS